MFAGHEAVIHIEMCAASEYIATCARAANLRGGACGYSQCLD